MWSCVGGEKRFFSVVGGIRRAWNACCEDALGAQPPLNLFDPLGLVADGLPRKVRPPLLRRIEARLTTVASACWGCYRKTCLLGDIDYSGTLFASIPNGFKAIPTGGFVQLLLFVGSLKACIMMDQANDAEPGEFPGDFRSGTIDFGWDSFDEETKLTKCASELNQGRAALMGFY